MLKNVFWRRPERHATGEPLSDKEIACRLRERISGELPSHARDRLRFYVREGAVTIYGTVLALEDRLFVKQIVRRTPGVTTVFDHLSIDR